MQGRNPSSGAKNRHPWSVRIFGTSDLLYLQLVLGFAGRAVKVRCTAILMFSGDNGALKSHHQWFANALTTRDITDATD
jgi:hypothetical protein